MPRWLAPYLEPFNFQITRSLSSGATTNVGVGNVGNGSVGVIDLNVGAPGTPGSPYRSSLLNGSIAAKPNLVKIFQCRAY